MNAAAIAPQPSSTSATLLIGPEHRAYVVARNRELDRVRFTATPPLLPRYSALLSREIDDERGRYFETASVVGDCRSEVEALAAAQPYTSRGLYDQHNDMFYIANIPDRPA